jgi:hypothetical protein
VLEVALLLVLLERQYPEGGGCGYSWDLVRGDNIENDLSEFLYGRTTGKKEEVKLYSFIAGRVNIRLCTCLNMFFTSGGLSR